MSKLYLERSSQNHSRHFFDYIRSIGESKSKQEEDKLVSSDLVDLKKAFLEKNVSKKRAKENVVRAFYAEMLGQCADFAYIHCVNLASHVDLLTKRTGYIATWLCVNPEHELMYLMVANLQKDMKSSNFLEVSAALSSCSKLIRQELMTCVNSDVTALISNPNPLVRKKAVLCMHSFYRKSGGAIGDQKIFREALCDKDPSVMGASLQLMYDVCMDDPVGQIDILPSCVSIFKQIKEHRLPLDFEYHRVPAPWLQIKLLKLMAVLIGGENKSLAEKYKDVLIDTMKRADTGLNIGHAIICECIKTITSIYPVPELVKSAADAIGIFLQSNNANMKYLGVAALSRIVKIDRKYAQKHQGIVMACLEDPDDTIRRKTLTLLFAMCNEDNVEAIVGRLTSFLAEATDEFLRQDLVKNICHVSEKFNTNTQWYVNTMNKILELGSEHIPQEVIQRMLKLIAEGEGEDEALDAELRIYCVETYFILMENTDRMLSKALFQIAAWVLGEYGFLTTTISRPMMIDRLCDMLERVDDATTKGWIITAIMKLVAHQNELANNVEDLVAKFKESESVDLQQRCYEFMELAKIPPLMKEVLPLDGCCEELEVDVGLSFLDGLVSDALQKGAKPYEKKEVRLGVQETGELRTEEYKTQRVDVVNEDELTADKFNEEDDVKLIVKDSAKRWGAKNLEDEVAVEKTIEAVREGDGEISMEKHVDPVADIVQKPTKNEKFLNDIFGATKKKKGPKKNRAAEALRRAQEAEEATRNMTTRNSTTSPSPGATKTTTSSLNHVTHTSVVSPITSSQTTSPVGVMPKAPKAPPENIVKLQTNIQKMVGPDCLRVRFGVLPLSEVHTVRVVLRSPPKCFMSNITTNAPNSSVEGLTVRIPMIPANVPAWIEMQLKAEDYPQAGMYGGEVFYCNTKGEECPPVSGAQNLSLIDVLRPATINPDQFNDKWTSITEGEARVQIRFKVQLTPDVLQKHIGNIANLKIIQVVGKDCIAASTVVPCGHFVLARMNVDGNSVNTTIRCSSKDFADSISKMLFIKS
eukprot:Tbor_TRINITY_DN3302_c0_g1::TRINITY_DN3302_c0_g1_i1::g.23550::m.23550/K12400/AP4E1; AP-4 complex subunit epsilon-1